MITENLSTLKIHKLTQEQYDRAAEAGTLDENALYLTPDGITPISEGGTGNSDGYIRTGQEAGTTIGHCSTAEGKGVTASGYYAHAEGFYTVASGSCSHAEGNRTIAAGDYQHVSGQFNIEDSSGLYANIVGNGTYTADDGTYSEVRSNAHTIDWDGNANFAGDVYVGNANENKAGKKLATEEYVSLNAAPSGYGLGTDATDVSSLETLAQVDNFKVSGVRRVALIGDAHILGTQYGVLVVDAGDRFIKQTLFAQYPNYGGYYELVRVWVYGNDGGWQPWEWVTPAMVLGKEYRTTERWNGQVVYATLIDCGLTATSASIQPPTGATRIIRHNAWSGRAALPIYDYINQSSYFAYTHLNTDDITIFYKADNKSDGYGNGGYHWYCQMWYTKE